MQTVAELLESLEEEALSLRTDMLMLRLFDEREDIPATNEVIEDYIGRVRFGLDCHGDDIRMLTTALCERLKTSGVPYIRAVR